MKLKDKRLLACAEMTEGDFICDIGTDHGYLPAYLLSTGKCRRAICADINSMPLDSARVTLKKENVDSLAAFILSDGLLSVPLEGVTDIVIAGMGGELIYKILTDDERAKTCGACFILQPMTRAEVLRSSLAEGGFEVYEEKGVSDGRFSYCIMKCRYTGKTVTLSPVRKHTGLLDGSRDEDRTYMERHIKSLEAAARGMENRDPARAADIFSLCADIRKEKGI